LFFSTSASTPESDLSVIPEPTAPAATAPFHPSVLIGGKTCHSFHAANSRSYRSFIHKSEISDFPGCRDMCAPAEFYGISPGSKVMTRTNSPYFSPKSIMAPRSCALHRSAHCALPELNVLLYLLIDLLFNTVQLILCHTLKVGKVKPKPRALQGPFLCHMISQHFAKRSMHEVGGRVMFFNFISRSASISALQIPEAILRQAIDNMHKTVMISEHPVTLRRSSPFEKWPGIGNLSARFCIKWCLVEQQ
jgi:hypothetical protein